MEADLEMAEEGMNAEEEVEEEQASRPSGCYRAFSVVLRLLVVVALGFGVGLGVYFGIPALYRSAIGPLQNNTKRISDLEGAFEAELSSERERAAALGEQLADIEGRLAEQLESITSLEARLARVFAVQEDQAEALAAVEELSALVGDLEDSLVQTAGQVDALSAQLDDLQIPAGELGNQIQLLRAMTLLLRARFWLVQDNLGLAAQDIEVARSVLAAVQLTPSAANEIVALVVERLDLALEDVRVAPIVAADELEIAWKLLLTATEPLAPEAIPVVEITPTEAPDE